MVSSTERAMGPSLSSDQQSVIAPVRGTRPKVGRRPVTPQRIEGLTMDPSVSLPMEKPTRPAAVAAPRASQRNSATTQAEPDFIAEPTTPALEQLGQTFSITDTSPLDPTIKIAPTIGVESALELFGHGRVLAAAEPVRRGGGSAGVVSPSG